jgi:hypothetical protein
MKAFPERPDLALDFRFLPLLGLGMIRPQKQ